MKNQIIKTFEKWKIDELHQTFKLKKMEDETLLRKNWLYEEILNIEKTTHDVIEKLRFQLQQNAAFWNDDELKFFFISQLISIVDFTSDKYKVFTQRPMSATIDNVVLKGVVDFVIATGIGEPQSPFFFLHEYKQERKGANDPLAQLLSEMLVAQALNKHKFPLYGCYILGRFWFFVVLEGTEYCISNAFNAADQDIFKVVSILHRTKKYINQVLEN